MDHSVHRKSNKSNLYIVKGIKEVLLICQSYLIHVIKCSIFKYLGYRKRRGPKFESGKNILIDYK